MVGPGQPFAIEWLIAHGGVVYFSIVSDDDFNHLAEITDQLLEEYIQAAPAAQQVPPTEGYRKFYKTGSNTPLADSGGSGDPNFFKSIVNAGDPWYIENPNLYNAAAPAGSKGFKYQVEYPDSATVDDRRVSYKSDKYPYIKVQYS